MVVESYHPHLRAELSVLHKSAHCTALGHSSQGAKSPEGCLGPEMNPGLGLKQQSSTPAAAFAEIFCPARGHDFLLMQGKALPCRKVANLRPDMIDVRALILLR